MKTLLYYFTGTGNSLAVARNIQGRLPDCELRSIPVLMRTEGLIHPGNVSIGIITPVYWFGLPRMVAHFATRLDLTSVPYCCAVVTVGGMSGAALHQLNQILTSHGHPLDAGWIVRMPGNYIKKYNPPAKERQVKLFRQAAMELETIARAIGKQEKVKFRISALGTLLSPVLYDRFLESLPNLNREFSVNPTCTSCGICEKVCPSGNIILSSGKPTWGERCESCMACVQFCPVEAIQIGNSRGRTRYHHPDVTVEDMVEQSGKMSVK